MKISRPPGRSTRAISRSAFAGSLTVQSTSVATAVSKASSAKGSDSAGASTTSTSRPSSYALRRRRLAIGSSGSVHTRRVTDGG